MSALGTVWLTGSGGFIGRYLVPILRAASARLVLLTPNPVGPGDPRRRLDLDDPTAIRGAVDREGLPDVCVHLGWGDVDRPESSAHLEHHAPAAETLIRTLYDAGLQRCVFVGTTNEYGARAGALTEDLPPLGFMTNYARGKWRVTRFGLAEAERRGRSFVSARLFYTYGAGQREGALLNKLYRLHREGAAPDLGPCEHYRDFIYAGDAAEGIRRLANCDGCAIVNLGRGEMVRMDEYVRLFWSLLGGDPAALRFGALPMRAGEPEQVRCFADLTRLRQMTGWTPPTPLPDGLRAVMAQMNAARD